MITKLLISGLLVAASTLSFGQTKPPIIGNDKDAHGCIGSAGYTFSILKNDCIRVFEQEIQLKETNPKGSSTSMVAVIFSKNTKRAEVFMPGLKSGVIMSRAGKEGGYVWKKGDLSLFQWKGYVLKRGKKVIFGGL